MPLEVLQVATAIKHLVEGHPVHQCSHQLFNQSMNHVIVYGEGRVRPVIQRSSACIRVRTFLLS